MIGRTNNMERIHIGGTDLQDRLRICSGQSLNHCRRSIVITCHVQRCSAQIANGLTFFRVCLDTFQCSYPIILLDEGKQYDIFFVSCGDHVVVVDIV
mmetsp:Transcript_59612/g.167066  ORF Transcript_59612/g.167066 Transcript_59612/m.167066 type:complete len:97 (-) Transcript_59612:38-328(-)